MFRSNPDHHVCADYLPHTESVPRVIGFRQEEIRYKSPQSAVDLWGSWN